MSLEQRTLERIAREFPESERVDVAGLLGQYSGREAERVIWDILELSKGKIAEVRHLVETARKDYRDILYWAEYYDKDPLVKGRDPKQMADEIIAKFGPKK